MAHNSTPGPVMNAKPMPDDVIERLSDLWCEALLANLRRHPIAPLKQAS